MSDLRGISRGSKAAALVVLIVLLQVIVLAFLGLGAIQRDRKEGVRVAAEETHRKARALADQMVERTWSGFEDALNKAAHKAREEPGALRKVPFTGWFKTFKESYVVDARGTVRASVGVPLYVPPEVVAEEEARAGPGYAERVSQIVVDLRPDLATRMKYVREYPYRADSNRYAAAVGEAVYVAEEAAKAATPEPGRPPDPEAVALLDEAVRLAYSTASVNASRASAERPGLAYVVGRLERVLAPLPVEVRSRPSATLEALTRSREQLEEIREYVLKEAKEAAARPAPPRVSRTSSGHLVGLVALPNAVDGREPSAALLVRISQAQLVEDVKAEAQSAGWEEAGFSLEIESQGMGAFDETVLLRRSFQDARFNPGLELVVSRSEGGAAAPATGPRETFYWFILGASTLGLATAGVVLFRILRREVHLARLKTDFVSNLSHELKTPLTSIAMFVEMYRDGQMQEGPELREGMEVIAQEAERLQRIVMRMIEVARRESASTGYDLKPGDLNAPVRAACDRFRRLERAPGLTLEIDLAPSLPSVLLDASAIDDAVANLLENAWKYRDGDRARIRVATRPVRRGVELTVSDDGIGIPRAERRRVFEMFYRADSFLTRSVPGTGLGLALVRTIVRVHRGKIRVEGAPGEGTTFRIRFRAAGGSRSPAPAPAPAPVSAPRAPAARGTAP